MTKLKTFHYFLFMALSLSACKEDAPEDNETPPQAITLNSYPLAIGNFWKYSTHSVLTDSVGTIIFQNDYDNYWTVQSDTVIHGSTAYKIHQVDSNLNGSSNSAFSYYSNLADGFYGVAVENSGSMFFLRHTGENAMMSFQLLSNFGSGLRTDSVFLPDTALHLMKFPSVISDIWWSHEYGVAAIIKRQWLGYETVTTPAGSFDCIKLQAFWDNNSDNIPDSGTIEVFQYFSAKGLIKETRFSIGTFGGGITTYIHQTSWLVHVNF